MDNWLFIYKLSRPSFDVVLPCPFHPSSRSSMRSRCMAASLRDLTVLSLVKRWVATSVNKTLTKNIKETKRKTCDPNFIFFFYDMICLWAIFCSLNKKNFQKFQLENWELTKKKSEIAYLSTAELSPLGYTNYSQTTFICFIAIFLPKALIGKLQIDGFQCIVDICLDEQSHKSELALQWTYVNCEHVKKNMLSHGFLF